MAKILSARNGFQCTVLYAIDPSDGTIKPDLHTNIPGLEALDSAGRPVPTASNLINFRINGDGALIGVGNGDPNCQESDKEPKRSLFNGLAQAIVQSTKTAGIIEVEASTVVRGSDVTPSKIVITTKKVDLRPQVG